jgi:hypothetical protein
MRAFLYVCTHPRRRSVQPEMTGICQLIEADGLTPCEGFLFYLQYLLNLHKLVNNTKYAHQHTNDGPFRRTRRPG